MWNPESRAHVLPCHSHPSVTLSYAHAHAQRYAQKDAQLGLSPLSSSNFQTQLLLWPGGSVSMSLVLARSEESHNSQLLRRSRSRSRYRCPMRRSRERRRLIPPSRSLYSRLVALSARTLLACWAAILRCRDSTVCSCRHSAQSRIHGNRRMTSHYLSKVGDRRGSHFKRTNPHLGETHACLDLAILLWG